MHSEKKIIKYSLAAIIIGLLGLYLASIYIEPEKVSLSEIDEKLGGKFIATQGIATEVKISNSSTLFMTLESNNSRIKLIQFGVSNTDISEGDSVLVRGEVTRYKGEIEIIAKDTRKI